MTVTFYMVFYLFVYLSAHTLVLHRGFYLHTVVARKGQLRFVWPSGLKCQNKKISV